MNAVDAITKNLNFISLLSHLNINVNDISFGMLSNAGAIAKIHVVGSENTIESINDIMSSIGTAIMELMMERSLLINLKNKIELLENFRTRSQNEIDRYILIMKDLNIEGNFDQRLWSVIQKNIDIEKGQIDKYNSEIHNLSETQFREHLTFTEKCMNYYFDISELLPKAILSVREELDLDIAEERYLDLYKKNINEGKNVFSKFLISIKSKS